ncbi:radical SAM protein, partial [bacterium]|nr:radical SAM protein [bacterium]
MVKLSRVCVPLSLDCNLHCKYCYRDKEKIDKIPEFTEDMKEYLRGLSPAWCECVCASGGEPLLHWDKVVELFSYVPKNVHKKIMSNCTLLTQEMVDYINENEIELHFSHDGKMTKFLRGVDVLENDKICNLIFQAKILRCFSVITKYNTDVWDNYFDTIRKLGRMDFNYETKPLDDVSASQRFLVEGFNYEEWLNTWLQFRCSPFYIRLPWYDGETLTQYNPGQGRGVGANVLPDGRLCGMINICSHYGTIHDTREEYFKKAMATGLTDYCTR